MTGEPVRAVVSQKAVVLDPAGRVLLLRKPGVGWELPGGRLARGERPDAGLRREVREETGLAARVGRPLTTDAWVNDAGDGRFAVVYRCRVDGTDVVTSAEHDESRWVRPADVDDGSLARDRYVVAVRAVAAD
ncbi:MAG: NUDIX domain-containing protein [Halobacteriaceae archaeon]